MKLYEDAFASRYEEMKRWYPVWYPDILEMDAILRTVGEQLDYVQAEIVKAVDNNFVITSDAQTLAKLEEFLYITYEGKRSIEERRMNVASFFKRNPHIGEQEIIEIISSFATGTITVSFADGTVSILVDADIGEPGHRLKDAIKVIQARLPAHLALYVLSLWSPIVVHNRNKFIFRRFSMRTGVQHYSPRVDSGLLDGSLLMDGSVTLGGIRTMGTALALFGMSVKEAYRQPGVKANRFAINSSIFETNNIDLRSAGIKVRTQNPKSMFFMPKMLFNMGAQQEYNTGLELTMDSMYTMDGTELLDGSKRMNAAIIKEEL